MNLGSMGGGISDLDSALSFRCFEFSFQYLAYGISDLAFGISFRHLGFSFQHLASGFQVSDFSI